MAIATGHGILSKQKRDNEMSYTDQYLEKAEQAEAERDEARRQYKQAKDYIKKMDSVIDDLKCAQSCINPLEDLKRATTALKERAEKAEAQLAEYKRLSGRSET